MKKNFSDILEYPWIKEFTYIKNAFFSCLCVHSDYFAQTAIYLVILYLILVFFVLYRNMSCFNNGLKLVKTKFFSFFICFFFFYMFYQQNKFFFLYIFFWIEISVKHIVNFINLTRQISFLSNLSSEKNFLIILHVTLLCSFLLCNLSNQASRQE